MGLPPGSLVDGEIRDTTSVSEAIEKLWKNGQFTGSSVIVGIAGLRAITREIDLPYVPDDEVDSAVRFQSEEVIPFPPDQTILSSQILADYTNDEGAKMRRVLVAAAHVDLVNGVIETVERAGLTVEGVDLISSALVRAIGGSDYRRPDSDQPEAIVSIGAGLTVVVVHQSGRPQFVRTIGSGGNATTAAISASLDVPIIDAETLKYRFGEDVAQVQAAERIAQPSMLELVDEIRNSHPVLRLASRPPAGVAGPRHRRRLRAPRPHAHARGPGPHPGALPAHRWTGWTCPSSTCRLSRPPGGPGAGLADRPRPAGAGQGRQEVQPAAARGRPEGPDQADPGPDPRRLRSS